MVQRVRVEGIGVVAFPDNMTPDQISSAIENDILKPQKPPVPDATVGENIKDVGISLAQGVLGTKEALTGLVDIPTMGYAGKAVEAGEKALFGGTSKDLREYLQQFKSEEQKAEEQKVAETKGFMPTVKEYVKNPGALTGLVAESVPLMLGGAGIARGIIGAGLKGAAAVGIGEGAITAGSIAEQARQESLTGTLTPKQAALSTIGGTLTGVFGAWGSKVAGKLDIDSLLAGVAAKEAGQEGAEEAQKSVILGAIKGALSESTLEELPQSLQEQIIQNLNAGRPWDEGVAEAAAAGWLAGGVMGAPGGALGQTAENRRIANKELQKQLEAEDKKKNQPTEQLSLFTPESEGKTAEQLKEEEKAKVETAVDVNEIINAKETPDEAVPEQQQQRDLFETETGPGQTTGAGIPVSGQPGPTSTEGTTPSDIGGVGGIGDNVPADQGPAKSLTNTLVDNLLESDVEYKNPAQLKKHIQGLKDIDLKTLETEEPNFVNNLFKSYKDTLKQIKESQTKAKKLKFQEYKKQAEAAKDLKLKYAQKELTEEEFNALPEYLKTVNPYAKEAPISRERGIASAAAEQVFETKDQLDTKGFNEQLSKLAKEETDRLLDARENKIKTLMKNEKISRSKAEKIVGNKRLSEKSGDRWEEFLTPEGYEKIKANFEGKKTLSPNQLKNKQLREDFINSLSQEEQQAFEQELNYFNNLDAKSTRERVMSDRFSKMRAIKEARLQARERAEAKQEADLTEAERAKELPKMDLTKPSVSAESQIQKVTQKTNTQITQAIESGKSAKEILNSIKAKFMNISNGVRAAVGDFTRPQLTFAYISEVLAKYSSQDATPLKIVFGDVDTATGQFDPDTNTITIDASLRNSDTDISEVLAHELLHYAMDHVIDNPTPEQQKTLVRLEEIRKEVEKRTKGKGYVIPNLKEFVAEAFSNPKFQNELANMRPLPGMFQRVTYTLAKLITSVLGIKTDPSVAGEVVSLVDSILSGQSGPYALPSAKVKGKGISYAPKKAGTPVDYENRRDERLEKLTVKAYHRPGATKTIISNLWGKKANEQNITRFQNSRYAIKQKQNQWKKAGLLKSGVDGFNNIYTQIALAFGEAVYRFKENLDKPVQELQQAIGDFAKSINKTVGEALGELHEYAEALHEPERRLIKYLKFVPLSNAKIISYQGQTISPAEMRDKIFDLIATEKQFTDAEINNLRTYLDNLVNKYKDAAGGSRADYKTIDMNAPEYNVTAELSSQDVQSILNRVNADPRTKAMMDNVLSKLKPIQEATIELNKQGNYWSQSTDNIKRFYNWTNYVPLKGKPDSKMPNNVDGLELQDKRLSTELKEFQPGFEGRISEAENPLVQTMVEAALSSARAGRVGLTQAVKNAIDQKLLKGEVLVKYSAQDIYKGKVEDKYKNNRNVVLHYNPDGSMEVLQIEDPRMLESIRRTYQEAHPVIDIINNITSLVGQSHTRYNPAFPILNFVRDTLTNAYNIAIDEGPMQSFQYIGQVAKTVVDGGLYTANKVARLYAKGDIEGLKEYAKTNDKAKDMIEFIQEGGLVSIVAGLSTRGQLDQLYNQLDKSKILKTKEQIDKFFDGYVFTFELAARSAAYSMIKSQELSNGATEKGAKEMAAYYAKNLANFEEVGEWGKTLGALFVFFRPSATGAVRAFESLSPMLHSWEYEKSTLGDEILKNPERLAEYEKNWRKQSRAATAVTLALLGAGATIYLMSAGLADDDDEGRNKIINDDLSRWTRFARFDIGKDKVVQIPWGFGQGGFMAVGAQVAGAMSSKSNTLPEVFSNIINIGLDSFLPLPVSRMNLVENPTAFAIDSITPSLARPFLEYAMNKNAFGQEIYNNRRSRYGDSTTGGDNIPDMYKDGANMMFELTNGAVDISPNTMYFFANNYFDGLTRIIHNGYGAGLTLSGQKDFDPKRDLILFESFLSTKSNVDQREFARMQNIIDEKQKRINSLKLNPEQYGEYISNHPMDPMIVDLYNKEVNRQLKTLREKANVVRRDRNLSAKERKELLDYNKEMQNRIKRHITYLTTTLKDAE